MGFALGDYIYVKGGLGLLLLVVFEIIINPFDWYELSLST